SNPCTNSIDVVADVDAIRDRAVVVIFSDTVLMKVGNRLWRWRRREADEKRIEVFERLTPQVVDRAMTFVGNDEVEFLDRNGGVVDDFFGARCTECLGEVRAREIVRTFGKLDRKSTRLNSSHSQISYAVFCVKKKNTNTGDRFLTLFSHYAKLNHGLLVDVLVHIS